MGYAILSAFILDMIFGDPENLPHPVRFIGEFITYLEEKFRSLFADEFFGGAALVITATSSVYLGSLLLVHFTEAVSPLLGIAMHAIMIFYSLSVKSLGTEAMKVKHSLEKNDIDDARKNLSGLVGRETDKMDEGKIIQATVETVAENSVDAVIAPLFFALIGGGPLALAYKAVNTCDSMVGYKNEKYIIFGKPSAHLDDAANFIPARLSIPLITAAIFILNMDYRRAIKTVLRDRLNHPSPNCGHPEATFAGALGIQLGGASVYGGKEVKKPLIGDPVNKPSEKDISSAVQIMRLTAVITSLLAVIIRF